ncbi:hypothetical protein GCM10010503_39060 [Streptomyces lucensis JCM 4490]|uniref:Uncharacterized protein n=1 Tax=Streptomyces lucensis JCM 4490 TaxID=1306176 RepID=A0A918MTG3_9ACTN|nr:hypothetical protein GCM10010503_39060 [Streptomyces lucensis JCM 4490]
MQYGSHAIATAGAGTAHGPDLGVVLVVAGVVDCRTSQFSRSVLEDRVEVVHDPGGDVLRRPGSGHRSLPVEARALVLKFRNLRMQFQPPLDSQIVRPAAPDGPP